MSVDLELFDEYLNGDNSPLFKKPEDLQNTDLTERKIDGKGTFDVLMSSVYAHLLGEFQKNRITGAEYAKVYAAMTEAAMGNAVQFLLQKENAYWQAVNGQFGALATRMQIELSIKELELKEIEVNIREQELLLKTKELELMEEQKSLIKEQMESQRAQTLNTRSDAAAVAGLIKSQKDLYAQQIDSYKRDAETKLGKLMIDTWTTQKTVDEGLTAPTQVSNANLDTLIAALRSRNAL